LAGPEQAVAGRAQDRAAVWAVCLLLVAAIGLVFGPTVRHGFLNYDDGEYVFENPKILNGLTFDGIEWVFTHSHAANWHPLTGLSHLLDCQIYGLWAGGHHLTNVLLHAATAILLFLVMRRMTGALWPSAFVAAALALHPLRVESVAWVAERKDVLSGLFFMLALGAYARYAAAPSWARYLVVLVLYAMGLMAKPMLVTAPFVFLLLDYWPLGRWASPRRARLLIEKVPLVMLATASCAMTLWAQNCMVAIKTTTELPFAMRLTNAVVTYAVYLGQFFCPTGLAVFYPHPADRLAWAAVAAAGLVLCAVSAVVLIRVRKDPYLAVGWFWYLGMLVPVIGLVQVGAQARADRYTYLPQIGVNLMIAWSLSAVCRGRRWGPAAAWAGGTAALTALTVAAAVQTSHWSSREALWKHTIACTSENYVAHNSLAICLASAGKTDEAIEHYQKAIDCDPKRAEAYYNLGNVLQRRGGLDQAVMLYGKALEINPQYADAHNNLGEALRRQGKIDEAIAHYRAVLELETQAPSTHYNLGLAYAAQGKTREALAEWRKSLRQQPDGIAVLVVTAWTLATTGDAALRNGAEAVELAERAARLSSDRDPAVPDALAAAYAETGQFPKAVQTIEQALTLAGQENPALAETLRMRIKLYQSGTRLSDLQQPGTGRSVPP